MKKQQFEEDMPSFLKDMKEKGDGFKVPEGYFEDLEDAVFARLEAGGDLGRPSMKIIKRPGLFASSVRIRTFSALAAALAIILAAVWFFQDSSPVDSTLPLASTELTEEDIESYVLENVHEFDPAQLAALTPEERPGAVEEMTPDVNKADLPASEEIHPDDLDQILDEMTDEELEEIL